MLIIYGEAISPRNFFSATKKNYLVLNLLIYFADR